MLEYILTFIIGTGFGATAMLFAMCMSLAAKEADDDANSDENK